MKPEEKARENIDKALKLCGWGDVQDYKEINLGKSLGVAVREFPLKTGFADYMLFVDRKAVGVIEAKPEGVTLSGVADQTEKYLFGLPNDLPCVQKPLPFAYESTGKETKFRDKRDPIPCSRGLFAFHQPETLWAWLKQEKTLRASLGKLPPLDVKGLRNCQIEAINNLDKSFSECRPRALIQMATGSGKTFTAISFIYRLIKFAKAKRVLFLVDRGNLGRQTLREFQQYVTPDDGRKFTELYNVQHLTSNVLDPINKVCICTIQRLYSMLRGEEEFDQGNEENSLFEVSICDSKPKEVIYNSNIPIETFDFIVTDECHRSIYNLWRQVLEYFDAFTIGLTATPAKQTFGFFHQNLVMEYPHERAVADGVNVGYEVFRIKTQITEQGSKVDSGFYVDKRDRQTRKRRWEQLDDDLCYDSAQLDKAVVAEDQIRTIVKTFRDKICTEIFPGRKHVPKTLIFAKDDSHAEDIVEIIREEFGKGNDFCKKITYRTQGDKPEDLINQFRNSFDPRIAVTVDMIATGTDIKPVECLLFMRNVRSRIFFEQMKGRGTRTIDTNELQGVTPDARHKTHFVIIDAIGVCETDKTDSQPLEKKKSVSFDKLIMSVALGNREEDVISSLAGRLARLDVSLGNKQKKEIKDVSGGIELKEMAGTLLDSIDPDKQEEKAKEIFKTETPDEEQIQAAAAQLKDDACKIFDNSDLRNTIIDVKRRSEQTIDTVSADAVLFSDFDEKAKEKARTIVDTFRKYIEDHKDELTALQIIYSQPYGKKQITYDKIREIAQAIEKPPYVLNMDSVWEAYKRLEEAKVKDAGPHKLLTNIVSLIRYAIGEMPVLEPFPQVVERRFKEWLSSQEQAGRTFTPEQREWLVMIKNYIAASMRFEMEAFELSPFSEKGGVYKAAEIFSDKLMSIIEELNAFLAA